MSASIPPPSGLPVLPPLQPYTTPQLPQGREKPVANALQASATPPPGKESIYDIVV